MRGGADEHDRVTVVGRGKLSATALIPPFEVADCVAPHRLKVRFRSVVNAPGHVEMYAVVNSPGSDKAFVPVEFRWDFGDGAT